MVRDLILLGAIGVVGYLLLTRTSAPGGVIQQREHLTDGERAARVVGAVGGALESVVSLFR